ncbi:MAG: DUF4468 domain-containing protein [Prevotella sp.]|nr:DUF4468 domain-containing protein [Prevotella sp.]
MKKILFWAVAMMMQLSVMAQEAPAIEVNESGAYEKKEVVEVEGASASTLYLRAMEALSDWNGPDGKAKAGIDYQDKESGTVIYKGKYYLGFHRVLLAGWSMYADFTLKVRTKDGKAQVTVTIPTMTGIYSTNNMTKTATIGETVKSVEEKGVKKRPSHAFLHRIPEVAQQLVEAMCGRLKIGSDDDDF